LFEALDHVLDLEWAYMYAATVVRKDTWEKLPEDVRPRLMELARDAGRMADAAVRKIHADALDAMRSRGLKVVRGNSEAWRIAVAAGYSSIRGGSVPAEFFDELTGARETCSFEAVRSPR
jgi:TRAP-type C4-dicarboxylate transport system substrate-binding protein